MEVSTGGLDLGGKRVFQVHGADASGRVTVRRKLQRGEVVAFFTSLPPCLVGMEPCATAHARARLGLGPGPQGCAACPVELGAAPVRQRTMLINALCGHQAEFGIIAPAGHHRVGDLVALIQEGAEASVPKLAREASLALIAELQVIEDRVGEGRSCSGTTAAHAG